MSGPVLVLMVSVVAVSLVALLAVLIVYFTARGPARAGLASLGVAAALVGPVAGVGAASYALTQRFSNMAVAGSGGTALVLAGCAETALLIRVGCVAAALTLGIASLLGWVGRRDRPPLPSASARRMAVLALPAVLSFLLVGGALEYSRRTRNTIIEVVASPEPAASSADAGPDGRDAQESASPGASAGSIAEISQRLALGLTAGVLGVPFLFMVLAGFASATAILAWRVQVPTAFAALSTAWMLLQAGLWVAAIFVFGTPVPAA
jgi:hypothetical protein